MGRSWPTWSSTRTPKCAKATPCCPPTCPVVSWCLCLCCVSYCVDVVCFVLCVVCCVLVADQIRLWEAERDRLEVEEAALFQDFGSDDEYTRVRFIFLCVPVIVCAFSLQWLLGVHVRSRCWLFAVGQPVQAHSAHHRARVPAHSRLPARGPTAARATFAVAAGRIPGQRQGQRPRQGQGCRHVIAAAAVPRHARGRLCARQRSLTARQKRTRVLALCSCCTHDRDRDACACVSVVCVNICARDFAPAAPNS